MAHKKLKRFEEIKSLKNVLEYPTGMPGDWKNFFQNNNPLVLELACGKGEYSVELAKLYPNKNFIGVDIKGNRIWAGAKKAINEQINNAAFLRTQIDKINDYFNKDEVSEIWITFPDPFLRKSKAKKRLTHPKFLRMYNRFLKPGGYIHLKTDSPDLYQFTRKVIELYELKTITDISDLYKDEKRSAELKIKTYYESLDISGSKTVFYLCFSLPEKINESDDILKSFLKEQSEEYAE